MLEWKQIFPVSAGSDDNAHTVARRETGAHDVQPDETRSPKDDHLL